MNVPKAPKSSKKARANNQKILDFYWEIFTAKYQTEIDCLEALLGTSSDSPPRCTGCSSYEIERVPGERSGKCKRCNKTVWLTAGTFFDGIKAPRAHLAAIWLMERGVSFSGNQLSALTGVCPSTAWNIIKRIKTVILDQIETDDLAIRVSSAHFAPIFGRRSVLTPANEHPSAEQEEMEKRFQESEAGGQSQTSSDSSSSGQTATTNQAGASGATSPRQFSPKEQEILNMLSDKPIDFQTLSRQTTMTAKELSSTLIILELEEFVQSMPGDRFIRTAPTVQPVPPTSQANADGAPASIDPTEYIEAVIGYVKGVFHGISRKYLQLYLAAYWCLVDREYWKPGSLIEACRRFHQVELEDIQAFVSPLMVHLRAA